MISAAVRQGISDLLSKIELEHRVKVLYACESGSRAWGFASQDSDYDCRFIYVHEKDFYTSIDSASQRDVIEMPIGPDLLDVGGWDLRKALQLLARSNPPLLEWLHSPIVYRDSPWTEDFRKLTAGSYSSKRCLYHYLSMASGNFKDYLKKDQVWTKKYLYVLRPVLACRWLEQGWGIPPVEFSHLLDACLPEEEALQREVKLLVERKMAGVELDDGPKIPVINDFLESEIARLKEVTAGTEYHPCDLGPLNAYFRSVVGL